jgi:hypothetical protein
MSQLSRSKNSGDGSMVTPLRAYTIPLEPVQSKTSRARRIPRMLIVALGVLLLFANLPSAIAQPPLPGKGVRFHYRVHKLGATVITASLSIEEGNPHYLVKANVDTTGVTSLFFRMHNRFSSYIKEEGLVPFRYIKEINQRGIVSRKKRYTDIFTFDPDQGKVLMQRADLPDVQEIPIPPQTYDPLSIFLKCFCDTEPLNGRKLEMKIYDGIKVRDVTFVATSAEVKTHLYGTIKTVCLESKVAFNSLGDKEGIIKIWYTDDVQRIPVQILLELPTLGDVNFELDKVEKW